MNENLNEMEVRNEKNEVENNNVESYETYDEGSKLGVGAVLIGLAAAGAVAYGAAKLGKKGIKALEKHQINKLRKKGYIVEEPEIIDEEFTEVCEGEVVDEDK